MHLRLSYDTACYDKVYNLPLSFKNGCVCVFCVQEQGSTLGMPAYGILCNVFGIASIIFFQCLLFHYFSLGCLFLASFLPSPTNIITSTEILKIVIISNFHQTASDAVLKENPDTSSCYESVARYSPVTMLDS